MYHIKNLGNFRDSEDWPYCKYCPCNPLKKLVLNQTELKSKAVVILMFYLWKEAKEEKKCRENTA